MKKEQYTILVTDSGLGGLNVVASLRKQISQNKYSKKIKLIYFNSLPKEGYGYNSMNSFEEKVTVFNKAINSMAKNFVPDIILIACNTLSVVYEHTEFFRNPLTKVMGIVDIGVRLILKEYNDKCKIVLFGTPTTINGKAHKNLLLKAGVPESNIIEQPCKNLESEIQINASAPIVEELITKYLSEAVPGPLHNTPYLFALCCTHYEFSIPQFNKCISSKIENFKILNPNELMVTDALNILPELSDISHPVEDLVVSKTIISPNDIENIGKLIEPISKETNIALNNYICDALLF